MHKLPREPAPPKMTKKLHEASQILGSVRHPSHGFVLDEVENHWRRHRLSLKTSGILLLTYVPSTRIKRDLIHFLGTLVTEEDPSSFLCCCCLFPNWTLFLVFFIAWQTVLWIFKCLVGENRTVHFTSMFGYLIMLCECTLFWEKTKWIYEQWIAPKIELICALGQLIWLRTWKLVVLIASLLRLVICWCQRYIEHEISGTAIDAYVHICYWCDLKLLHSSCVYLCNPVQSLGIHGVPAHLQFGRAGYISVALLWLASPNNQPNN